MKSLEQQLTEQATELRELRQKLGKTGATRTVTEGATRTITRELTESGLPEAAWARVRKRLSATASASEVKRAIREEQELVRQVRQPARQQRLVESYKAIGLSEKEAGIAAGVEVAVSNVTEGRQQLANAAKLLGMTEAEAAIFSEI